LPGVADFAHGSQRLQRSPNGRRIGILGLSLWVGGTMNANKMAWNSGITEPAWTRGASDFVLRALGSLWRAVRLGLSAILEWLSPLVALVLLGTAGICYLACGFVYLFVSHSHFPMFFTMCFSTGCLAALVLYQAFLYLLNPDRA